MTQTPTSFIGEIVAKLSRGDTRLWRNNTGDGWVGKVIHREPGSITLEHPRVLHAGLCNGSSDLIGLRTIVITQEMVGRKVAVFTGIEAKLGSGRESEDQAAFRQFICRAGGLAGVAYTVEEAEAILRGAIPPT